MVQYSAGWCSMVQYTPNLPTKLLPTKIAWLKLSGNFPMDIRIPPLKTKIMLESNPLKSRILVRRLAVVQDGAIWCRIVQCGAVYSWDYARVSFLCNWPAFNLGGLKHAKHSRCYSEHHRLFRRKGILFRQTSCIFEQCYCLFRQSGTFKPPPWGRFNFYIVSAV